MKTLGKAPFNKIRFCVFPKHYDFNHNEPQYYPFEKNEKGDWNVDCPCFAYWEMLEEAIMRLGRMGIQCDLILFHPYDRWGFAKLSEKENLIYLDYMLRRLSAMPNVWWSIANEYDLVRSKTLECWEHIEEYLAEHDPYHHLISNHNCFKFWDHSRKNITHVSVQTKVLSRISEWRHVYQKPVCVDECCYEGNIVHPWGSISGKEMTYRFWRTVATGGYCTHGETFYSDDEVLWWSRGGRLNGESPKRIAFLKKIVEELPGPIDPIPDIKEMFLYSSQEEIKAMMSRVPDRYIFSVRAMAALSPSEMGMYISGEPVYAGHVGEEAYLTFYDIRTCARSVIKLPEDKSYRLELVDVWDMKRQVIREGVSGNVEFEMPGKEGMAVIAWRE